MHDRDRQADRIPTGQHQQPAPASALGPSPALGPPPAPGPSAAFGPPPAGPSVDPARPRPWKKRAIGIAAAATAALAVGTVAVTAANAGSASTQTASAASAASGAALDQAVPLGGAVADAQAGHPGGRQLFGEALHGELVVETTDGTVETRLVQRGEVTALADGSLTVVSSDDFTATYVVGADVDLTGVTVGDTVGIVATTDGTTATAVVVREPGNRPLGGFGRGGGLRGGPDSTQSGEPGSTGSEAPTGTEAPEPLAPTDESSDETAPTATTTA